MSTEQPDLAAALRVALKAAEAEVERVTQDRDAHRQLAHDIEYRLNEVERRLVEARQAYNSIRVLLEQQTHSTKAPSQLAESQPTSEELPTPEPKQWVEGPKNQVMSPSFVATSNLSAAAIHAIKVLGDAPEPLRPADVLREFEARGWVEPQWKTPAQSVYGALKRAEQAGMVSRNEDGRWQIAARAIAPSVDWESARSDYEEDFGGWKHRRQTKTDGESSPGDVRQDRILAAGQVAAKQLAAGIEDSSRDRDDDGDNPGGE